MSLKENIEAVKKEISTEEQFLEGIIKGERYFKKYKKAIIAVVAILIIGGVSYAAIEYQSNQNLLASNEAYAVLQKNPQDENARKVLAEKNVKLYNLFLYSEAIQAKDVKALESLSKIDDPVIADLANYHAALLSNKKIPSSDLLKGMVLLQEGYQLLLSEKANEAKLKFAQIELNSPVKNIANSLEHYQGK